MKEIKCTNAASFGKSYLQNLWSTVEIMKKYQNSLDLNKSWQEKRYQLTYCKNTLNKFFQNDRLWVLAKKLQLFCEVFSTSNWSNTPT